MNARMNPADLANIVAGIRDRFPVSAVAARMGVKLRRAGNEMKACCPFHADRTPSFTIYADDRRAHCFGCGWSGDVLDLVQHGYGDNVGVVIRWTPPDAFDGLTADHLLRVQRRIDGGSWKESVQAKEWVGYAVAEALGLDASKADNSDRKRIGRLIRTWIANGALVVVNRRDPAKREDKPFVEVGQWADQAGAPLSQGGAVEVGQGGAPQPPRPTSPPLGEVGGAGGARACVKVGQSGAHDDHVAGNPALGPVKRDLSETRF